MRLDNAPMGIRRGGKLPMKDLVKAANGNIEGLKHLLKTEWELPEDTNVAVYGIDCDGAEFEFTPMVADDLLGMLQASSANTVTSTVFLDAPCQDLHCYAAAAEQ